MTDVENAERAVATLEDKRKHWVQKAITLADERNQIAYAAHVEHDQKAVKRLDAVNTELAKLATEQASIEAALAESQQRLEAARQAAAETADKANAEQLRGKLAQFTELGAQIDDALFDVVQAINAMVPLLHEMHQLGQAAPTSEQFRINGCMAIKTALQELPQVWVRDFEFQRLAPNQKKRFGDLCAGWSAMIERQIAERFGEPQRETAA
jgi:chromosome segregation ATPase